MKHTEQEYAALGRLLESQKDPQESIAYLHWLMDQEIAKAEEDIDEELIQDCVAELEKLEKPPLVPCAPRGNDLAVEAIFAEAAKKQQKKAKKRYGKFGVLAACMLLVMGVMSMTARYHAEAGVWNIFGAIASFTDDVIALFVDREPAGTAEVKMPEVTIMMRQFCENEGIQPLLPTEFPGAINLYGKDVSTTSRRKFFQFELFCDNKEIVIAIRNYFYKEDVPPLTSVSANADEVLKVGKLDIYIINSNDRTVATFLIENNVYQITSQLEKEDFYKVLKSLK